MGRKLVACTLKQFIYDIPEGSGTILAVVPIASFMIPIDVHTLAKTITGMSSEYMNSPGNGHFVSSACVSKSSRGSGKFEAVLVREC